MRTWLRNQLIRLNGWFRSPPVDGSTPVYRFLTYHRIPARQRIAFEGQLDRLAHHHHFVTPGEFEKRQGKTGGLNLLLTFDDGYLEWETFVIRALRKRNLKAVFFVNPDFVGLSSGEAKQYCRRHLTIQPASPLTPNGIRNLRGQGHTIGNHLLKHTDLRDCRDPDRLDETFEQSQRVFEDRFDLRPTWVAYPFGDYFRAPERLREVASRHFDYGTSLVPGYNRPGTPPLMLHRDGFSPGLPQSVETAWLSGGYDALHRLTHLFTTGPGV